MLELRKLNIYLLVLLCFFLANPTELGSQEDCVFPTGTEEQDIRLTLVQVECVDGMGDYAILGGTPPYELWERDLMFSPDWYPVGNVNNIFSHTCSSDGVSSCGLDLEIKIIDSNLEESNILPIFDPGTCGQLQPDPNNPEEITCGTDITISVEYGCAPFTWELLSDGYTLSSTGDERSKILSCSGNPCSDGFDSVAEIRVTDDCGQVVLMTVRNMAGEWMGWELVAYAHYDEVCGEYESSPSGPGSGYVEFAQDQWGKYKWRYRNQGAKVRVCYTSDPNDCCEPPQKHCGYGGTSTTRTGFLCHWSLSDGFVTTPEFDKKQWIELWRNEWGCP